jgi:hypothetical protein
VANAGKTIRSSLAGFLWHTGFEQHTDAFKSGRGVEAGWKHGDVLWERTPTQISI